MKYLKSFKKSEVGSSNFYSNKDIVFSNYSTEVPYGVLTAIEDSNNGADNNITIKYQWVNSNTITIYGQSNGSIDDFYLRATYPTCVGISNGSDEVQAQLEYYMLDQFHFPNFPSNSKITKLALHEQISQIDADWISNGVNGVDSNHANAFGNLQALYLMNTSNAVTITNKPNNKFARNTDLYVPSNLSIWYSSSEYYGFKSVNYF